MWHCVTTTSCDTLWHCAILYDTDIMWHCVTTTSCGILWYRAVLYDTWHCVTLCDDHIMWHCVTLCSIIWHRYYVTLCDDHIVWHCDIVQYYCDTAWQRLCDRCDTCKKTHNQHLLVKCDNCCQHHHLSCLDPPLVRMPKKTKLQGWSVWLSHWSCSCNGLLSCLKLIDLRNLGLMQDL